MEGFLASIDGELIAKKLKTFFHPERFQGWGRTSKYFEGWYYKVINAERDRAFAFIPGIAFDAGGNGHAFVQVLDGIKGTSEYHRFDATDFVASDDKLEIQIGPNHFSEHGLSLDLPGVGGELRFDGNFGWPKPFYSPGIMGPYAFAPFMQCYHGIVSMDHAIQGELRVTGERIDFDGGRGYLEKDWGRSFPSAYVWMQSNHFETSGNSFKASVANIPWLTGEFTGFISGLLIGRNLIRFTTYNRTKLIKLDVGLEHVDLILENPSYRLIVHGERDETGELASPIMGSMHGKIEETMRARLRVHLEDSRSGRTLFKDTGHSAGLEVAGDIEQIVTREGN